MRRHLTNIARYEDILNNYDSMAEVIMARLRSDQEGISAESDALLLRMQRRLSLKKRRSKNRKLSS